MIVVMQRKEVQKQGLTVHMHMARSWTRKDNIINDLIFLPLYRKTEAAMQAASWFLSVGGTRAYEARGLDAALHSEVVPYLVLREQNGFGDRFRTFRMKRRRSSQPRCRPAINAR